MWFGDNFQTHKSFSTKRIETTKLIVACLYREYREESYNGNIMCLDCCAKTVHQATQIFKQKLLESIPKVASDVTWSWWWRHGIPGNHQVLVSLTAALNGMYGWSWLTHMMPELRRYGVHVGFGQLKTYRQHWSNHNRDWSIAFWVCYCSLSFPRNYCGN